jgi:transposase
MPEEFYELARPMLPPEKEIGPLGGRPPKGHRVVLKVIWFVLVTSCRWKDVPQEMGCCGETARTRLQEWERAGIWSQIHHVLLTLLHREHHLHLETAIIDTTQVRAFGGGDATGPSPVDRRKKRHEIHAVGRSRRRAPGASGGTCQSQRPVGNHAGGGVVPRCWRSTGPAAQSSQRVVCGRRF